MEKRELPALVALLLVASALIIALAVIISNGNKKPSIEEATEPEAKLLELEKYINKYDSTYSYRVLPEYTSRGHDAARGYTVFMLNMTSQTWLSPSKVSHTQWWHYMSVVIPDDIVYPDTAGLYLTGGSNNDAPRHPMTDPEFRLVVELSVRTGMVLAQMTQMPNGPIQFFEDPEKKGRSGDDLIAYTFKYYMEGHLDEAEAVLLLPMVKSAVRGMDTLTNFVDHRIQRFFLAGFSKRGWTTWLTAAVDKRIIAIAPIVLDFLSMEENFAHHYRSLNGWSWALKDYWYHNVTTYLFNPDNVYLTNIVDPISYREKLLLPKYLITAGSDEFFLPDDAHYFYKDMLGPTYLRVHPNTDHPLIGRYRELLDELEGFILMVLEGGTFPNIEWTRTESAGTGTITVWSNIEPMNITAWSANSFTDTRRDFRLIVAGTPNTTETEPQPTLYRNIGVGKMGDQYRAEIETPRTGWNCFFIEMMFPAPKNSYITFTTEVHIVPDTFPSDDCQGYECRGTLY